MVPVLAGVGFFAVLALFLWGVAAYISNNRDQTSASFAPTTFDVGHTKSIAASITKNGPLIFPDLLRSSGLRTIVLDHTGDDPQQGWHIYMAYPKDRDVACKVEQVKLTRNFVDCDKRTIATEGLALPPPGVFPNVFADGTLSLHLIPTTGEPTATTTTS